MAGLYVNVSYPGGVPIPGSLAVDAWDPAGFTFFPSPGAPPPHGASPVGTSYEGEGTVGGAVFLTMSEDLDAYYVRVLVEGFARWYRIPGDPLPESVTVVVPFPTTPQVQVWQTLDTCVGSLAVYPP